MNVHNEMIADLANRRSFIGGSDARTIMGDDESALVHLWREREARSSPRTSPATSSSSSGVATEPLNRQWFAQFRPRLFAFTGLPKTYA